MKVRGESKVSITHKIELELSDEELLDLRRLLGWGSAKRADGSALSERTWRFGNDLKNQLPTARNLEI